MRLQEKLTSRSSIYLAAGGLGLFFVLAAFKTGLIVSALVTLSVVAGYLNEFYVLRVLGGLLLRRIPSVRMMLIGLLTLLVTGFLVHMRFGVLVAAVTASVFLLDALLLRFK